MRITLEEINELSAKLGSHTKVAQYLDIPPSTFRGMVERDGFATVSQSFVKAQELEKENTTLKKIIANLERGRPKYIAGRDTPTRVIAIGDTHDQPDMDKERFKWIARYCGEVRPNRIVHIGDFASWDSVSAHEMPGSVGHAERPRFKTDLDSCQEAMSVFLREIRGLDIPMELTAGNHEDRISRFENKSPETYGSMYFQFEEICAQYRWRLHNYGQWLFIDGVGFTHVPKNIMGRPYGGQQSENAIANHATHSIVFGHTHRATFRKAPKIGNNNSIEVLNLGSAMPEGYVAKYAGTATSGWSYGIYDLSLKAGHIVSHRFINMAELKEKYE